MQLPRRDFLKNLAALAAGASVPTTVGAAEIPASKAYPYLGRTEDYLDFRIIEPGLTIAKMESWTQGGFGLVRLTTRDGREGYGQLSPFEADISATVFLRRQRDQLTLTVEHRAAPSLDPIPVQLTEQDAALALATVDSSARPTQDAPPSLSPEQRVLQALVQIDHPVSVQQLRQRCRLRTSTLCETLQALCAQGRARRTKGGYRSTAPQAGAVSASQLLLPLQPTGNGNGKQTDLSSETEAGSAEEQPAEG